MGIFKGSQKKRDDLQTFDPFVGLEDSFIERNLFGDIHAVSLDSASTSQQQELMAAKAAAKTSRTIKLLALLAGPLCVLGFFAGQLKPWEAFLGHQSEFAYFEVRALDVTGHPIAGAVVKNEGKLIGTTDSFGEWRQYMPVTLGRTVSLTMAKKTENELLYSTKNFAIPPVKGEKIEIRGTTQLVRVELNNTIARKALYDPSHNLVGRAKTAPTAKMMPSIAPAKTMLDAKVKTDADPKAASSAPQPEKSAATPNALALIPFVANHTSVWFEGKGANTSHLNRSVLPELIKRAKEMGLTVDPSSTWRVQVVSLMEKPEKMTKDGGGVILVSSHDQGKETGGNTTTREFLRNYLVDPKSTARGILYGLSHQVNNNVTVSKQGDRWVATLPKNSAKVWSLTADQALRGNGILHNLSTEKFTNDSVEGLYLQPSPNGPCTLNAMSCELTTASYDQVAPIPGWARLRLAIPSSFKAQGKIFVSGYEANLVGDKLFEYWGQNLAKVNVTVVGTGAGGHAKILSRTQVVSNAKTPPSLGSISLSRK